MRTHERSALFLLKRHKAKNTETKALNQNRDLLSKKHKTFLEKRFVEDKNRIVYHYFILIFADAI